jgi:hypothetical protein
MLYINIRIKKEFCEYVVRKDIMSWKQRGNVLKDSMSFIRTAGPVSRWQGFKGRHVLYPGSRWQGFKGRHVLYQVL